MAESSSGNGTWKTTAVVSLTLNITLITGWFLEGRNWVTHDELRREVQRAPFPWLSERAQVLKDIAFLQAHAAEEDIHERGLKDLARRVEKLEEQRP